MFRYEIQEPVTKVTKRIWKLMLSFNIIVLCSTGTMWSISQELSGRKTRVHNIIHIIFVVYNLDLRIIHILVKSWLLFRMQIRYFCKLWIFCVSSLCVFAGKDYYKILSVPRSASAADIKVCKTTLLTIKLLT